MNEHAKIVRVLRLTDRTSYVSKKMEIVRKIIPLLKKRKLSEDMSCDFMWQCDKDNTKILKSLFNIFQIYDYKFFYRKDVYKMYFEIGKFTLYRSVIHIFSR